MRRLVLGGAQRAAIARHVAGALPDEACGLLIGRRDALDLRISEIVPSANVAAEPRRRFEIDPALILRHQRETRGRGDEIVGHFHSHPGGRAEPSAADRKDASWPDQVWLIVANDDMRAFWCGGNFDFDAMEIVN